MYIAYALCNLHSESCRTNKSGVFFSQNQKKYAFNNGVLFAVNARINQGFRHPDIYHGLSHDKLKPAQTSIMHSIKKYCTDITMPNPSQLKSVWFQ